ncbi:MAG TPA: pirin family protein [Rhabdochlamydiaceae bacterium]|nr:pirin family protein [Rhabdochlamydiaceae bacterium]
MITLRKSKDRGHFNFGWLDTYHTFSFGEYDDPEHEQFGVLRVINEDRVAPAKGFDKHSHENMEIVTYVIAGTLEHTDSTGERGQIKPGDVQRMTAGSGIRHSEANPSSKDPVHLLQIWIFPDTKNLKPGYEQKNFPLSQGRLNLIVSPKGEAGSLKIHQDVKIFACRLQGKLSYALDLQRMAWIQVIEGPLICNGKTLQSGDGAGVSEESELNFESTHGHFLLFDLPPEATS